MRKTALASESVHVADNFFTDADDLLRRFKIYYEQYFDIKSRRFKSFIDLRMAMESLLKSICALYGDHGRDRRTVIREVESYRHSIADLLADAQHSISSQLVDELRPYADKMSDLPVGLRYTLDGYDFISAKEELYYETIGNDSWMSSLYKLMAQLRDEVSCELSKHSGVISLSEIPLEMLMGQGFNKYRNE